MEGDNDDREKIRRESEKIDRQVQAQVEEKEKQGNDRSKQPDHDMEDQGGMSSPEDEEMGMTEQADAAEGERGHKKQELVENKIAGLEVQGIKSARDLGDFNGESVRDRADSDVPQAVLSATSDGRGQEVETASWSSYEPHNRVGFQEIRTHAERKSTRKNKPQLIIGSSMCVMFSQLQKLSSWSEDKQIMSVEAKKREEFTCEIHAEEAHLVRPRTPAQAISWNMEAVRQIRAREGDEAVIADHCMYGLLTWSKHGNEW